MKLFKELIKKLKIFFYKDHFNNVQMFQMEENLDLLCSNKDLYLKTLSFSEKELDYFKEKFYIFEKMTNSSYTHYFGYYNKTSLSYNLIYDNKKIEIDLAKLEDDYYFIHILYYEFISYESIYRRKIKSIEKSLYLDQFSSLKKIINKLITDYDSFL